MFITLRNFTRQLNLQQNVFDKMLSEEMLSIKNIMHEKDITYTPTLQALPKVFVATPTLVVKQNWLLSEEITAKPIGTEIDFTEPETQLSSQENYSNISENNEHTLVEANKEQRANKDLNVEEYKNEKVLGLRSLSHHLPHVPKVRKESHLREGKLCTCTVTNPSTSRSHVCTGQPTTKVTHLCTRKHPNPSAIDSAFMPPPYPMQFVPSYYLQVSVPSDIYDYETSTRKRKHKHHKKIKDHYNDIGSDNLYYDGTKTPVEHEVPVDYDEGIIDDSKVKVPTKNQKDIKIITDNQNGLVDSLVEDLQKYFSEDVIKECYCSKKSDAIVVKGDVHMIPIVICLIKSLSF